MKSVILPATNENKLVLITGSARRLGKEIALAVAAAGYAVIIHTSRSFSDAEDLVSQIINLGGKAKYISADFSIPEKANEIFIKTFADEENLFALINNASIFEPGNFIGTSYESWQMHFAVNLTTPFLISQAFAKRVGKNSGRIINILDWRALRPGKDHFSYTISKSALVAMTKAMALALAPNITVNGLALGAILPPSDGGSDSIIKSVPLGRWGNNKEVTDTVLFLLTGPEYITGEIIHLDGGRHLV
ncbi:MAG: SDR family oxidoreductase [Pelolinea sp.]|nr:SDR family oxidoreductase [Pelolinea sp.]